MQEFSQDPDSYKQYQDRIKQSWQKKKTPADTIAEGFPRTTVAPAVNKWAKLGKQRKQDVGLDDSLDAAEERRPAKQRAKSSLPAGRNARASLESTKNDGKALL